MDVGPVLVVGTDDVVGMEAVVVMSMYINNIDILSKIKNQFVLP